MLETSPMVLLRVLGEESRVLLVRHEQADPHGDVHHDEGVVRLREEVPRHGNALEGEIIQLIYVNMCVFGCN